MKALLILILPVVSLICIFISFLKGLTQNQSKNKFNLNVFQEETPSEDDFFLNEAFQEAKKGLSEGGIPIGSVIVVDKKIIGRGYNRRVQFNSSIQHGEMNALENMGRQKPEIYRNATLYTTLTPCEMCSGAILFYKIPRVVIGDNVNDKILRGGEDSLRRYGVEVIVLNKPEIISMFSIFKKENPTLWGEASVSGTCHQMTSSDRKKLNPITNDKSDNYVNSKKGVVESKVNCSFLYYCLYVIGFFCLIVYVLKIHDAYRVSLESLKNMEDYMEI
jgi:creatinine deaminase